MTSSTPETKTSHVPIKVPWNRCDQKPRHSLGQSLSSYCGLLNYYIDCGLAGCHVTFHLNDYFLRPAQTYFWPNLTLKYLLQNCCIKILTHVNTKKDFGEEFLYHFDKILHVFELYLKNCLQSKRQLMHKTSHNKARLASFRSNRTQI